MELLTVVEAARLLRVSRQEVYRLMNQGRLPFVQFCRSRRIRREDLEQLIRDHLVVKAKAEAARR